MKLVIPSNRLLACFTVGTVRLDTFCSMGTMNDLSMMTSGNWSRLVISYLKMMASMAMAITAIVMMILYLKMNLSLTVSFCFMACLYSITDDLTD